MRKLLTSWSGSPITICVSSSPSWLKRRPPAEFTSRRSFSNLFPATPHRYSCRTRKDSCYSPSLGYVQDIMNTGSFGHDDVGNSQHCFRNADFKHEIFHFVVYNKKLPITTCTALEYSWSLQLNSTAPNYFELLCVQYD